MEHAQRRRTPYPGQQEGLVPGDPGVLGRGLQLLQKITLSCVMSVAFGPGSAIPLPTSP